MSKPQEAAAALYPGEAFEADFDVYHRLALDLAADMVHTGAELRPEAEDGSDVARSVAKHVTMRSQQEAIESAAYATAQEAHQHDAVKGTNDHLTQLVRAAFRRDTPVYSKLTTPLSAAERQRDNYVLADVMRYKPRYSETEGYKRLLVEYCADNDDALAKMVDDFETRAMLEHAMRRKNPPAHYPEMLQVMDAIQGFIRTEVVDEQE